MPGMNGRPWREALATALQLREAVPIITYCRHSFLWQAGPDEAASRRRSKPRKQPEKALRNPRDYGESIRPLKGTSDWL